MLQIYGHNIGVTVSEALQRLRLDALPEDSKVAEERLESLLTGAGIGEVPSLFEAFYILENELKQKKPITKIPDPVRDLSLSEMYAEIAAERDLRATRIETAPARMTPANIPLLPTNEDVAVQSQAAVQTPAHTNDTANDEALTVANFETVIEPVLLTEFKPQEVTPTNLPKPEVATAGGFFSDNNLEIEPIQTNAVFAEPVLAASQQIFGMTAPITNTFVPQNPNNLSNNNTPVIGNGFTPMQDNPFEQQARKTTTNSSARNSVPESIPDWSGEIDADHNDEETDFINEMRNSGSNIQLRNHKAITVEFMIDMPETMRDEAKRPLFGRHSSGLINPEQTSGSQDINANLAKGLRKLKALPRSYLWLGTAATITALWLGYQVIMFSSISQLASTRQAFANSGTQNSSLVANLGNSRSGFNQKLFELWQQSGAKLRYPTWNAVPKKFHELELEKFEAAIRIPK